MKEGNKDTDGIIIEVINGKEEILYTNEYVFNEIRKLIKENYGKLERNSKK